MIQTLLRIMENMSKLALLFEKIQAFVIEW